MTSLSALSNVDGKPVDWFFMYKLPIDIGPHPKTTGFEYLYMDAGVQALKLSPVTMDHDACAVALTLAQVFNDAGMGYVLWNDEQPPTPANPKPQDNGGLAHSKGILGFSKATNSGFYLLHSTPRFPAVGVDDLPLDEDQYGQTYLCITVDYATANQIADVLRVHHNVQVYGSNLADAAATDAVALLATKVRATVPAEPAAVPIQTIGGQSLEFFGKNKAWSEPAKGQAVGKDFWSDLVGPTLKVTLNVETWRRGTVFSELDADPDSGISDGLDTEDVLALDLTPIAYPGYKWPFSKDHAKWGISEAAATGQTQRHYVIIGDINRQVSQENRGGGGLCIENEALWRALHQIESNVDRGLETAAHVDEVPK